MTLVFRPRLFRAARLWLTAFLVLPATVPAAAQVLRDDPTELRAIDVEEHPGEQIPLDLACVSGDGVRVTLGDYVQPGRPVILILGYYTCPMLCNLVFNGVTAAVKEIPWTPGREYRIVSVSIDPRDTDAIARAKRDNYRSALEKPAMPADGWDFLTCDEATSQRLADAVGFRYYYDEEQGQYAHAAVITILTGEGRISRYLYGIEYRERDVRLALVEASDGRVGNTIDRIILSCYHYDPDAGSYVVFAAGVMRLGGAGVLLLIVLFLGALWIRERRRRHDPALDADTRGVA